jgi:hypothetical protein
MQDKLTGNSVRCLTHHSTLCIFTTLIFWMINLRGVYQRKTNRRQNKNLYLSVCLFQIMFLQPFDWYMFFFSKMPGLPEVTINVSR